MDKIGAWLIYAIICMVIITIWRVIRHYIKAGYNTARDKTLSSLEPAVELEILKEKNFENNNSSNRGLRILVCSKSKNTSTDQNIIIDKINDGIRSLCNDKAFDYKMKYVTENKSPVRIFVATYKLTYSNAVHEFETMNKENGIVIKPEEKNFMQCHDIADADTVIFYLFDNLISASVNVDVLNNFSDLNHVFTNNIINLDNNTKNVSKKLLISNSDPYMEHFIWLNGKLIGSLSKLVFKAKSLSIVTNNSKNVIYLTQTEVDKERYTYCFFEVISWDNDAVLNISGLHIELFENKSGLKRIKNNIYDI
jgi:hypothetical protein